MAEKFPERWRKIRTLGEGGQSRVYLVEDATGMLAGQYALKLLSAARPRQAYERFAREIAAIKEIQHPSVIKIYDHPIPSSEIQYYVMEYIEKAVPLDRLLQPEQSPFCGDPIKSLDLFIQLLDGLQACHLKGIIHRDLSPANILLEPATLAIKIIDFGICQIEGAETITLTDEGVGTPNYMAPETESGSVGDIKPAADLYSAGKILWSVITNRRAFAREEPIFRQMSMKEIFPSAPHTWHLHHIFVGTIRRNYSERWTSADDGIKVCRVIRRVIQDGYLPLESLAGDDPSRTIQCPICGIGRLEGFQGSHQIFGNPNPEGYVAVECTYCGYCWVINLAKSRGFLAQRRQLT